jgi:hypothetical protein
MKLISLAFWIFQIIALTVAIQAPDNKGIEFFLCFPQNYVQASHKTSVYISAEQSVQAAITAPGIGFSQLVNIAADSTVEVVIPFQFIEMTGVIENKGVWVRSLDVNKEISVVGLNQQTATTDAYLALPLDTLGTEYVLNGYNTLSSWASHAGIVATEDGTQVTVFPSNNINGVNYPNSQTFNLNKFQTLYLQSSNDVTGSRVVSNKRIGVVGGHRCANVLVNQPYCDTLMEYMAPVNTWANEFLTVPLATRRAGDVFRVMTNENGNVIQRNGVTVATINRYQYYEYITGVPERITTSKPALLVQYSRGTTADGVTSDPFSMWIPPTAQFSANYFITNLANFDNWINIVIENGKQGGLNIDGAPLGGSWFPITGTTFVATQRRVSAGFHHVYHNSPIVPFGIYSYGWADFDSYGYPGGIRLAPLQDPCTVTAPVAGDGIDNDCDQRIDEELNNGIDDDGDGRVDEDLAAPPPRTCCEVSTVAPSVNGAIVDLTIQCGQSVPGAPAVTGHIDCPEPTTVTLSPQTTTTPGGCTGTSTIRRTWQIVDDCGRSATRVQTINVVDTSAPSLNVPSDRVIECGQSTLPFNTGLATATDSCSGAISTVPYSDYIVDGSCTGRSTITRTWTATDACGNSASGQQTITVVDTTSPSTSAQNLCVFPPNGLYKCYDVGNPSFVSASDTCSSVTLSFNNDCTNVNTGNSIGCSYNAATKQLCVRASTDHSSTTSYSFSFTATDACGNSRNQPVTVSVPNTAQTGCSTPDVCMNDCPEDVCPGVTKDLVTEGGDVVGFAHFTNKLNGEVSVEFETFEGLVPDRGWWMKGFVFTVGSKRTVRDFAFGNEQSRWFETISFNDAFPGQTVRCGDNIDVLLVVQVTNDKRNNNAPRSLAYLTLGASKRSFELPPGAETRTTEVNICCECKMRTQTQNDWGNLCTLQPGKRTSDSARIREAVCRRDEFWTFASAWCFPNGIQVGCSSGFTATFTDANALAAYLDDESTPAVLSQNWVNPPTRSLGGLAGETAGLALNLKLDECDADWSTSCNNLRGLTVCRHPTNSGRTQCQPFWGLTVGQIFDQANSVLGGCSQGNVAELFECVRYINRAFVDGKALWEAPDFVANAGCASS